MSLIRDDKLNRMYSSADMVAKRAPAKEISEVGKIKLRHHEEKLALGARQQQESEKLHWKHQEMRNDNIMRYRTNQLHDTQKNQVEADIKAIRKKHDVQTSDMRERQRLELERHFKAHGITP